jgi:hypothetical protein
MTLLTQRQAAQLARRIPFDPPGLDIFPEVKDGLERIAAKQLRRIAVRPFAKQARAVLREQLGNA